MDELIAAMRTFAVGGGVGFYSVATKSGRSLHVWIEDINKCTTDEALIAHLQRLYDGNLR